MIAILVVYSWIEIAHFTTAYQEPDPDGYLILAKRIARGGPLKVKDDDIFMYQSHVWVENDSGEIAPKFSPGYPLIMALFYLIGGDSAMFVVSPLLGGIGLIGAYLLFRLWMSNFAALLGTLCLATNTMFLIYSGYLLTHATNLCFIVWGMYFLWRWMREERLILGAAAGLLLGFALIVRYTSILMGLVIMTAVVSKFVEYSRKKTHEEASVRFPAKIIKTSSVLIGCWTLFPFILASYNYSLFGNPLKTGYSLTVEQSALSWTYFLHNLSIINKGLNYEALFMVMPLGIAGMFLAGNLTEVFMRVFWFLPLYIVYTAYYWAPVGMAYYRFLICAFPVIIGSAFALLDKIPKSKMRRVFAMTIFLAILISIRFNDTKRGLNRVVSDPRSRSLAESARIISKRLEDSAVIFSQPPIYCYLGTRRNFRLYDLREFSASYGRSTFNRAGGVRQQPKRRKRLAEFYRKTNDYQLQKMKRNLIAKFISNSRQVAYFIPRKNSQKEQKQLGSEFRFELLKEWKVYLSDSQAENWELYNVSSAKKLDN